MKKIYLLILAILMISCDESHFANSVMKDIGNGKYVPVVYGDYSGKASNLIRNNEVFSMAEVRNAEANRRSEISNFEHFFDTEVMFDNFRLLETTHLKEDLLKMATTHKNDDEVFRESFEIIRDSNKLNDKNFVSLSDSTFIYTNYQNIDEYLLKYKISTKQASQIAYLTVIKIPGEGYRVTSFKVIL